MKNIYSNIYKPTNNNLTKAKIIVDNGGVVAKTPEAEMYINETYDLFLAALEAPDEEYDSLEDLLMRFGK